MSGQVGARRCILCMRVCTKVRTSRHRILLKQFHGHTGTVWVRASSCGMWLTGNTSAWLTVSLFSVSVPVRPVPRHQLMQSNAASSTL